MRIVFLLLIAILGFSSCDESRIYENSEDYKDRYWLIDSLASFQFDIPDSSIAYNVYFNVRNTNNYPYHNLYVQYALKDSSEVLKKELINNFLFNEKTGEPYGSGLGDLFSHQFKLLDNYRFDKSGSYTIDFQHYMREDSLSGIVSAGVRVEKAGKEN